MEKSSVIAEFIAPYIGASYPNDKEKVFKNLSLVQDKIWRSGLFYDSTKYFYVQVDSDGNIITPHGYNVLLGCNIDFKPITLSHYHSVFHKNGTGERSLEDKNFFKESTFLGESPVMVQPNDLINKNNDYFITVQGGSCDAGKHTDVLALDKCDSPIYTYYKNTDDDENTILVPCLPESNKNETKNREGIRFAISHQPQYHKEILVKSIYAIFKEETLSPVRYYLTDKETGVGTLMAELQPYDIKSSYKRYKISGKCIRRGQILGLFKRSAPVEIVSDEQLFLSGNKEAILLIAKGFYLKIDKEDVQKGDKFISDGIMALREEIQGNRVGKRESLQVNSTRDFSKTKHFI